MPQYRDKSSRVVSAEPFVAGSAEPHQRWPRWPLVVKVGAPSSWLVTFAKVGRPCVVSEGDWIITDEWGHILVCPDGEFQQRYRRQAPEE